jgi:hypothetical protein
VNLNLWKAATIGLTAVVAGAGGAVIGTQLSSGPPSRPAAAVMAGPASVTSTAAAPAPSGTPLLVTPQWSGIKPSSITLSADGGNIPYDLTWSQWNDKRAVAKGLVGIQSCNPNCAQGTTTPVPVRIILSDVHGGHYTHITESIAGMANPTPGTGPITSRWPFTASRK